MAVTLIISLFGKPAWEIDALEGGELTPQLIEDIRKTGNDIKSRLDEATEILTKLLKNGWNGSGGLYDIDLYKDTTLDEAQKELDALGIDLEHVNLMKDEEEEDDGFIDDSG